MNNKLYKTPSPDQLTLELESRFSHPAITLFRGRELVVVSRYMKQNQLDNSNSVLDLGCGEGHIGELLFNRIHSGIDITKKDLEKAKERNTYEKLVLADAKKLPFKDNSFDIVFSNSVIEHIDGIDAVLSEVTRVLKKDGLFIFTAPSSYFGNYLYSTYVFNRLKLPGISRYLARQRNIALNHYNLFNADTWKKKLNRYYLKVINKQYYLSIKDMHLWDWACVLVRLTKPVKPLNMFINSRISKKVRMYLAQPQNLKRGASLFIVARKSR